MIIEQKYFILYCASNNIIGIIKKLDKHKILGFKSIMPINNISANINKTQKGAPLIIYINLFITFYNTFLKNYN